MVTAFGSSMLYGSSTLTLCSPSLSFLLPIPSRNFQYTVALPTVGEDAIGRAPYRPYRTRTSMPRNHSASESICNHGDSESSAHG